MNKFKSIFIFIIASILTTFIAKHLPEMKHEEVVSAAGPLATVAGILFGFVLASISLLSGASGNTFIRKLKTNNILPPLLSLLNNTGVMLVIACLLSLLSIFMPPEKIVFLSLALNFDILILIVGLWFLISSSLNFIICWRKISIIIPNL